MFLVINMYLAPFRVYFSLSRAKNMFTPANITLLLYLKSGFLDYVNDWWHEVRFS